VLAGKAAGMQVVAVPSLPSKDARPLYSSADVILSSLLDFQPDLWGLPPLNDRNSLTLFKAVSNPSLKANSSVGHFRLQRG